MAITPAVCNSFKGEILQGIHDAADTYKIALYTSSASLDKTTTAYSATNEVATGGGYTAGGATLSGYAVTADGDSQTLDFSDPVWSSATITARGAVIYNSSKSNRAVAVLDFGSDISSGGGNFTIQFPAPGAATGLVRIS